MDSASEKSSRRSVDSDLCWSLDFLWCNPFLADVDVDISEAIGVGEADTHEGFSERIPAHAVLLCQHSLFMRTMIELQHQSHEVGVDTGTTIPGPCAATNSLPLAAVVPCRQSTCTPSRLLRGRSPPTHSSASMPQQHQITRRATVRGDTCFTSLPVSREPAHSATVKTGSAALDSGTGKNARAGSVDRQRPRLVLKAPSGKISAVKLMLHAMYNSKILHAEAAAAADINRAADPDAESMVDNELESHSSTSFFSRVFEASSAMLPSVQPGIRDAPLPRVPRLSEHGDPAFSHLGVNPARHGHGQYHCPPGTRAGASSHLSAAPAGTGGPSELGAQGSPDGSGAPLQLLLDVVTLADQYQADAVMQAAACALMSVLGSWTWSDAMGVLALPHAPLTCSRALAPLLQAAREIMWEAFADLEGAWRVQEKRLMWLQIPACGIEWLLRMQDLKVASENTVFVALTRWVEGGIGRQASQQQLCSLASLLRVHHLSLGFLLGVVRHCSWYRSALAAEGPSQPQHRLLSVDVSSRGMGQSGSSTLSAGSGRGVQGRPSSGGMEEVLAMYMMQSSGMASELASCMPDCAPNSIRSLLLQRREQGCRPCDPASKKATLHISLSMGLLEQALNSPGACSRASSAPPGVSATAAARAAAGHLLDAEAVLLQQQTGRLQGRLAASSSRLTTTPREEGAGGGVQDRLPEILAVSGPVYFSGYFWVLEVFLAENDPVEDCLGACLYAVCPAVSYQAGKLPDSPDHKASSSRDCATGGISSRVLVTAGIQLSVYDHQLEEWGLLYAEGPLPARTGFAESGSIRYSEYYPIWNRNTLQKLLLASAWQRRAYAPNNKLCLKAEILSVK